MSSSRKEIEVRYINLGEKEIRKSLKKIGAKKVGSFFFREWVFAHPEWRKAERRVRVRTDGQKTWLTYKANKTWAVDSTEEIEVTVSNAEEMVGLMHAMDIPQLRHQEKKRDVYELDGITFDLDFWPKIPMVLEIEAASVKKVKDGVRLLGLSWEDAIVVDQAEVHRKYYGIDMFKMDTYVFEKSKSKKS